MAPTDEQIKKNIELEPAYDEGDIYDDDTGEFLGNVATQDKSLPAQLAVFHAGYWYVFKPIERYKQEKEEEKKIVTLREELSGSELATRAGTLAEFSTNKDITLP
jgi:hypothetical protein